MSLKLIDKMYAITIDIVDRTFDTKMNSVTAERTEVFNKRIGGMCATSAVLKAYEQVRETECPNGVPVKDNLKNAEVTVNGSRFED